MAQSYTGSRTQETQSRASWLASLPSAKRERFIASLTDEEALALEYDWSFWARPEQLAPAGKWETWLALAGRGWGKTRTGAEWVRDGVENGNLRNVALIGPTARDVRKVMVEGDSGILAVSPPWCRPNYEPSKLLLEWPNGAVGHLYSAEEPDRLRGPNHDGAWADELAAWKYLDDTWANLEMTLRGGNDPKRVVTTTPKPKLVLRELLRDPSTAVTRGSTFDNRDNLATSFLARLKRQYEGTRTGRQELYAELLEEAEGALWTRAQIEKLRRKAPPADMKRIVVAIDPAVTATEQSDETGIVAMGIDKNDHGNVLADRSGRYTPDQWASVAVKLYNELGADLIVGEVNNGGEMIEHTLRTVSKNIPYKAVHASRGKRARAEPVAALYEQGKVHHCGTLAQLEDQMVNWEPLGDDRSPDRLDAMVWAATELMVTGSTYTLAHV